MLKVNGEGEARDAADLKHVIWWSAVNDRLTLFFFHHSAHSKNDTGDTNVFNCVPSLRTEVEMLYDFIVNGCMDAYSYADNS